MRRLQQKQIKVTMRKVSCNLRGDTMKKQRNHQEVYVLKVTVPVYGRPDPSRTIAIVEKSTIYTFAMAIL
jgi:hypothetical protein